MYYNGVITVLLSLESRDDISLIDCPADINPTVFSVFINALYEYLGTFDFKFDPAADSGRHFCFLLPVYDVEAIDTLVMIPLVNDDGHLDDIVVLKGRAEDMDYLSRMYVNRIDSIDDTVLEQLATVSIDYDTFTSTRIGRYVYRYTPTVHSHTVTDLYTLRSYDLTESISSKHIPKGHASNYDNLWPLVCLHVGKEYNKPVDLELVEIKRQEGLSAIRRGLDTNRRLFKILGIPMVCESIQFIGVSMDDMVVSIGNGVILPPSAVEWVDSPIKAG